MEKVKLLIVEDMPAVLALYAKSFGADLFDIRTEPDGPRALATYEAWRPEVILLDIVMPGMSGIDVLAAIRVERADDQTVIVMASGQSEAGDIETCKSLGIQGFIMKPFKLKTVEGLVLMAMSRKDPERARGLFASRGTAPEPGAVK